MATYQPVSKWLFYQGAKIAPEELLKEFKSAADVEAKLRWEYLP